MALGALGLAAPANAITVQKEKSKWASFQGDTCGSLDSAAIRLPRGARQVRPLWPALGTMFYDDDNDPVADLVQRKVVGGTRPTVRFVAAGSGDVCAYPEDYEYWGWWTRGIRLRVSYKVNERVYIKFSGRRQYKPRTFYFGASSRITSVRWRGWNQPRARGRGVLPFNDCVPYCAAGNITNYRVKLLASRARRCDGKYFYLKLRYTYANRKPPGVNRSATMRTSCDYATY